MNLLLRATNDSTASPLKEYTHIEWATIDARAVWEPRLREVQDLVKVLEVETVRCELRLASIVFRDAAWIKRFEQRKVDDNLGITVVRRADQPHGYTACFGTTPTLQPLYQCVLGKPQYRMQVQRALLIDDHNSIAKLLGYPQCCCEYFIHWFKNLRLIDPTRDMLRLLAPSSAFQCFDETNMFLRAVGIRAVYHLPCSFLCNATVTRAQEHLELARHLGFADRAQWLMEFLRQAFRWRTYNGEASIVTPLFTIKMSTDVEGEAITFTRDMSKPGVLTSQ